MKTTEGWKKELQSFVDQVVHEIYHRPQQERNMLMILEIIGNKQREINEDIFPSQGCYYIKLAQIMDHLIQQIILEQQKDKQAWFCQFWNGFDEISGQEFSLDHVVIQQSEKELNIKKYVFEGVEEQLQQFHMMVIQSTKHMFQRIPDVIETIVLSTGKRHIFWPKEHSSNGEAFS
ncbi:hypothetical protein GLW08_03690 [Pontibacillus yanchengensis]|uniref:Uncharacterized protein n=2 Tax=Pontibacillus yanchengensis TaxID=462910 RepID=A0ACC7VAT3_9BACI|nr:hypothetical protein [Pontibacillus yanchengensis]MYL35406.1 hypothetical protein [Pontibacillus yanchengensis]MYL52438.1 hypothetical protein [Pontibacillus yanchengensis]